MLREAVTPPAHTRASLTVEATWAAATTITVTTCAQPGAKRACGDSATALVTFNASTTSMPAIAITGERAAAPLTVA